MNALEGNLRIVEDGGHFLEEDGFETFSVARSDARLHDTIGNVWLLCIVLCVSVRSIAL